MTPEQENHLASNKAACAVLAEKLDEMDRDCYERVHKLLPDVGSTDAYTIRLAGESGYDKAVQDLKGWLDTLNKRSS